ncbi:hypothetical protein Tco_0043721 [Tanacetum coccineum]
MSETPSPDAITTSSPIEEPKDSLIMEDEDINTIPEKESDEENESSFENLFHILSESKVTSDNESECDLPIFDDSPLDVFEDDCVIFSRPLFDSYGDSTSSEYSSDNESVLEEDIFYNRPFKFDVESISSDVNPIYDEVLEDIDGTNYLISPDPVFGPLSPVLETLLPFSSENEDKVYLLSHRGFNPSKIIFDFSKSPMMIYGEDIPILDVLFLHFYPP